MNKQIVVLLKIYKGDLNPFDECALECALSFNNADVTAIAMAPLAFKDTMESLTRLGVKSILISDPLFAGSDTIATSKVLAKAINKLQPDLVFAGRQSIDGDTAQVPIMVSELTQYKLLNRVMAIDGDEVSLRNGEKHKIDNKQIITFEKFKLLRAPSILSKKGEVTIWTNEELKLPVDELGMKGSPTQVIKSYQNQNDYRLCKFIDYKNLDNIIKESLNKNSVIKEKEIHKAPLIHYVGNIAEIAQKYGKTAKKISVDNLTVDEIAKRIKESSAKIVLWEEGSIYKELAARVAIKMSVGLCADCTSFDYIDDKFIITRPALGGDVFADIVCSSDIAMATVRNNNGYRDDVAITIGRGAIEYYERIEQLAKKYNAKMYCSRPIADEGKMDYSKQVGLTGTFINPKVCIAIGVSGAIQHVVGINKSQTIIGININKKEPIFNYVDYGIVMDAKDI